MLSSVTFKGILHQFWMTKQYLYSPILDKSSAQTWKMQQKKSVFLSIFIGENEHFRLVSVKPDMLLKSNYHLIEHLLKMQTCPMFATCFCFDQKSCFWILRKIAFFWMMPFSGMSSWRGVLFWGWNFSKHKIDLLTPLSHYRWVKKMELSRK